MLYLATCTLLSFFELKALSTRLIDKRERERERERERAKLFCAVYTYVDRSYVPIEEYFEGLNVI